MQFTELSPLCFTRVGGFTQVGLEELISELRDDCPDNERLQEQFDIYVDEVRRYAREDVIRTDP